jgi:hypothetical protein
MKKWLWAFPALFLLIQFFQIDKTNPPADPSKDYLTAEMPPPEMAALIKAACYDCHSNQTKYPWYSYVAPVSWLLRDHIVEGREHLNFSEWTAYPAAKKAEKLEECGEMVSEGEMPMYSYVWLHPEANLSAAQQSQLAAWFGQEGESTESTDD